MADAEFCRVEPKPRARFTVLASDFLSAINETSFILKDKEGSQQSVFLEVSDNGVYLVAVNQSKTRLTARKISEERYNEFKWIGVDLKDIIAAFPSPDLDYTIAFNSEDVTVSTKGTKGYKRVNRSGAQYYEWRKLLTGEEGLAVPLNRDTVNRLAGTGGFGERFYLGGGLMADYNVRNGSRPIGSPGSTASQPVVCGMAKDAVSCSLSALRDLCRNVPYQKLYAQHIQLGTQGLVVFTDEGLQGKFFHFMTAKA